MVTIPQVAEAMQTVLTTTADDAARETRFVQRESKLGGAAFAQTLVLGWLENPEATLEELSQTAAATGTRNTGAVRATSLPVPNVKGRVNERPARPTIARPGLLSNTKRTPAPTTSRPIREYSPVAAARISTATTTRKGMILPKVRESTTLGVTRHLAPERQTRPDPQSVDQDAASRSAL